jgi:hypothetical protein
MCHRWVRVDVLRQVKAQFPEEPICDALICSECHKKIGDHGPCRLLKEGRNVQVWIPLKVAAALGRS